MLQPDFNLTFHLSINPDALALEHVLVKWANEDEYAVASFLQQLNRLLEKVPLQRRLKLNPLKIIFSYPPLGPGNMFVLNIVGRSGKLEGDGISRILVWVLQCPCGQVHVIEIGNLQMGRQT